eukprot:2114837-Rhodomonas_salina.1
MTARTHAPHAASRHHARGPRLYRRPCCCSSPRADSDSTAQTTAVLLLAFKLRRALAGPPALAGPRTPLGLRAASGGCSG